MLNMYRNRLTKVTWAYFSYLLDSSYVLRTVSAMWHCGISFLPNHSARTKRLSRFNANCTICHSLRWENDWNLIPFWIARGQSHSKWRLLFWHTVEFDIGRKFDFAFERRRIDIENLNYLTNPIWSIVEEDKGIIVFRSVISTPKVSEPWRRPASPL